MQTSSLIILFLIGLTIVVRIIWNISYQSDLRAFRLDACSLSVLIEIAELCVSINDDEEDDDSRLIVLQAQIETHLLDGKSTF